MTAKVLILTGLFVEIVMSLGVLTGIAESACRLRPRRLLHGDALLWKQFWATDDFTLWDRARAATFFGTS
ncbi:hypothetical protein [Mesorhizobium sp. INR15]|uniref:hypothetical protein n=1 Tax=Mesorhizobium sp. INR15 TaxID=2654248 RepID=UPI0021565819|nr:hypothetical protein [Mesorhizobium sp. INR15]